MIEVFTLFAQMFLFQFFNTQLFALDIPELKNRVTDQAGILSKQNVQTMEAELAVHESKTTVQIVVLILPTLEGEALEDFSMKIVEKIKLGQKGKDNGILFLMAVHDRLMRIEVGYGLEGQIPDARTRRIQEMVKQYFRNQDYDGGVRLIVSKLIQYSDPEIQVKEKKQDEIKSAATIIIATLFIFLFLALTWKGLFALPFVFTFYNSYFGNPAGLIAIAGFGLTFALMKFFLLSAMGQSIRNSLFTGTRSRSGWGGGWGGLGGGSGGGGFGGGGFGGSGFGGGGGGSFGGGGSSSSW